MYLYSSLACMNNIVTCKKDILNKNYILNCISRSIKNDTLQFSRVIPIFNYYTQTAKLTFYLNITWAFDGHRHCSVRRKIQKRDSKGLWGYGKYSVKKRIEREPPVLVRGRAKGVVGTAVFPSAKRKASARTMSPWEAKSRACICASDTSAWSFIAFTA